jgi:hypothetical protein
MSLICKIKHKWSYSETKINTHSSYRDEQAHITFTYRLCNRCYKKQVQILDNGSWQDTELSKDELREIKLKKIGI